MVSSVCGSGGEAALRTGEGRAAKATGRWPRKELWVCRTGEEAVGAEWYARAVVRELASAREMLRERD